MKVRYTLKEVAAEAHIDYEAMRRLVVKYAPEWSAKNQHKSFTTAQKDALVRLRWLDKDWQKCVEYCWKLNMTNPKAHGST